MRVHYGAPGLRAACGGYPVNHTTRERSLVTCNKCRGTLKFRHEWFAVRTP